MSSRGFESFQRQARSHGIRIGSLARGPLTPLASISSRLSFVCVAVSEPLEQLRYEQHGLSAPVRKRTQRAGAVPCVPYAAASRADRSCTFYRQDHRPNQRRQLPVPLQFLLARDQAPYATGIYPADSYPEEKIHNRVGSPTVCAVTFLVPRLPAESVKCGGDGRELGSSRAAIW